MLQWIREQIASMDFDSRLQRKVELASEEALINIINHGQSTKIEIEVKAFPKSHVEIAIKDEGLPFNPLQKGSINLSSSLEEREIGGVGIHLMLQCMDEVQYKWDQNKNILTLIKKC